MSQLSTKTNVAATACQAGPPPAEESVAVREVGCSLCGRRNFESVANRDRRGQPLETVVCCDCGLVCHASIPSRDDLDEYYRNLYRRDYHGRWASSDYRLVREWNRGWRLYRQLQPYLPKSGSVFEIGAGLGCNLKPFELSGYEAIGIEPGEEFARLARDELRANVACLGWESLVGGGRHDLVLLVHVLEHLRDPVGALRRAADLAQPTGVVYIEVPNLVAARRLTERQFHAAHIFNFTPATLDRACRLAGLELLTPITPVHSRNLGVLARRLNPRLKLDPVANDYPLIERILRQRTGWPAWFQPSYVIDRLITVYRQLDERFRARSLRRRIIALCAQHSPAPASRHAA